MRFLIDMPLSPALATRLEELGHEAIHAVQASLDQAADDEILERAREEDRIVVTADLDYPRLLAMAHASGPGLILFRGGQFTQEEALNRIEHVLKVVETSELPRSILVIEKGRIRRRSLPL